MLKNHSTRVVSEVVKQLRDLRKKKGLSHEALAEKAGVSRPAVSHIESGKRKPSLVVTVKLCDALEVDLSEILREVEKHYPLPAKPQLEAAVEK